MAAPSPSIVTASVRGVAEPDPSPGTVEMPVAFYIDGVFLGRAQGVGLELMDPERIEVLRGPQGQLFGRNAEGGVVQFVTRKPPGEFGLRASASYGRFDDRRFRLAVDLPEAAGFSATIAGISSEHDGYTENNDAPQDYVPPQPQEDYGFLDAEGFRAALRWSSDDGRFTADYAYDHTEQDDSQSYLTWTPVNTGAPPTSPVPSSSNFEDESFDRQFNQPFKTKASGHALTLNWQLSDQITIKSISSYREVSRRGGSNLGSGGLVAGVSSSGFLSFVTQEDVDQDQRSQEFQFIGTWERFDLTAGAIYFNEQVDDQRPASLTGPGLVGPVDFIVPEGLAFCVDFALDPCLIDDKHQEAESDSYGVYAQGAFRPASFDNRLEFIFGVRYSDDSKDGKRTFSLPAGGPVDLRAKYDGQRVDPAFTVRYQWNENLNTYLRYATGFRAGGVSVRSELFTSFDEETSETWEIGLKSLWAGGRVRANLALFHNTIEDEQITVQAEPINNPNLISIINSPNDKKVKGVEAEFTWAVTDFLRLGLSFTYLDAKKVIDVDNPFTPDLVDLTRFWVVQTPETTGSVYVDFERQLSVGSLAAHASYAYSDDYQNSPGAIPVPALQPDFKRPANDSSQLVARLAWRDIPVGDGTIELALWGRNLTDDDGLIYGFDGCAFGGGFCTYRAFPRTYGIELRYSY